MGSLLFLSCDSSLDGNRIENQPPRTFLTVDNIAIDEDNRLSSRVDISWWGDDPDGYIVGYEYAIGDTSEGSWNFTTRTDSTFILPISPGEETDDVLFAVRAIDNDDAVDPVGASVVFPLRNSPPITELNALELPPDTTYGLFSFGWNISDPDGQQTILRTEIAFNDTANGWTEIPIETEEQNNFFISLRLENGGGTISDGELFLGRGFRETDISIEGIQLNETNTFFVRTVDRALAVSEVHEFEWFVKRQKSKILVLNDQDINTQSALSFHLSALNEIGLQYDVIDISDGIVDQNSPKVQLSNAFPSVLNPTLNKMLAEWDYIYWFSNNINRNITYADEILGDFFTGGGKLFYATRMRSNLSVDQNRDPIFEFLPVRGFPELESGETAFILRSNRDIYPNDGNGPILRTSRNIDDIKPLLASAGSSVIYNADFSVETVVGIREYERESGIAIMNSSNNFIYFGLDLMGANANNNIDQLLQELLINRLDFTQQ